jgi:hypothetical protein
MSHKPGTEKPWNKFFQKHIGFVSRIGVNHVILIDSTGLPKNRKFTATKNDNINGKISKEFRAILVIN